MLKEYQNIISKYMYNRQVEYLFQSIENTLMNTGPDNGSVPAGKKLVPVVILIDDNFAYWWPFFIASE